MVVVIDYYNLKYNTSIIIIIMDKIMITMENIMNDNMDFTVLLVIIIIIIMVME